LHKGDSGCDDNNNNNNSATNTNAAATTTTTNNTSTNTNTTNFTTTTTNTTLFLLFVVLLVTPVLSGIVTFASATNIAMVTVTTTIDTFCITGGPEESDFKLEESFLIKSLLPNPEDKSVAKNVAQKIQEFYFTDKSNSAADFSSPAVVRNNFIFCSHSTTKFSTSAQLGSLTAR
jgi:hypothetical protein